MNNLPHILIVDDEPFNIDIITMSLADQNYQLSSAEDGDIALEMLQASPESYDVILLDRMMPNMDGMDLLKQLKQHDVLQHCPVILQSAKSSTDEIAEGLEAGAQFYLAKPFQKGVLLSVVKTAVEARMHYKEILNDLNKNKVLMGLLKSAHYEVKTIDEARTLASMFSHAFPTPEKVAMGLTELLINAIEHGNLGISYDEKSILNEQGIWNDEVKKRLDLPQYSDKKVSVSFQSSTHNIELTIIDDGEGFDWQLYMDFDPDRIMDNHGRGIAIANKLTFTDVIYRGKGNEVYVRLELSN